VRFAVMKLDVDFTDIHLTAESVAGSLIFFISPILTVADSIQNKNNHWNK